MYTIIEKKGRKEEREREEKVIKQQNITG